MTAVELVHTALDLGVNLVDTAEAYARGVSETIVGRALEGRRADAFLATKVTPTLPTADRVEEHGRLSAMRLGVDSIDLYQVHWPNPAVPVSATMEGMRRLQTAGLVRHVGVSNFSAKRWARAEAALGSPVLSNQVQYSLLHRRPDQHNVPYAQANDRLIIAYSPLAQGVLGGRYDADHLPPGPARRNNPLCLPENLARATPLIQTLRRIASSHDATPAQVALAWLIAKPNVVAIPGASSVEQLRHNVAAADLDLDRRRARGADRSERRVPTARHPPDRRRVRSQPARGLTIVRPTAGQQPRVAQEQEAFVVDEAVLEQPLGGGRVGAVHDAARIAGDHSWRDREEELVDEPERRQRPRERRTPLGDDHLPGQRGHHGGQVHHALADAEVRHTRGRGVGVLRQHEGRPTGIEEPHVGRGLGPGRDHVDLQMRLRRWSVLFRVDGADADEHGISVVAQRAEHRMVDAVAEPARQSRHLARAIRGSDHVQADERPVGRSVVGQCDMAGHQLVGRRAVLGVEDAHERTLAGVRR